MLVLLAVLVGLAPLVTLCALVLAELPRGTACPSCDRETIGVRSWVYRATRGRLLVRWCLECGWEGLARNAAPPPPEHPPARLEFTGDADDQRPWG